jgi:hypothetical protein
MQKSTSKLLRSLSLTRAGLAPALVILLLGATAPRLAAQSDNFDEDGGLSGYPGLNAAPGWTPYTLGNYPDFTPPYYGAAIFSFPTNPASAGNYAYRIQGPAITNDSMSQGPARAGSFHTDVMYGDNDGVTTFGRFSVGADVVAWNTNSGNWADQVFGLAWYASDTNLMTTKGYFGGWGSDLGTLGIIAVDLQAGSAGDINAAFAITAYAAPANAIALDPTHQYHMQASSHDGETFLLQLFDLAQPNNPWVSAITDDTTYINTPGYSGMFECNYDLPPPDISPGNSTAGVDVTWDNYSAYLPAAPATHAMPAVVTDLSPQPGGKAPTSSWPTVNVGMLNRDTTVNQSTIRLYLDGAQIPYGSLTISNYVYKPYNPQTGGADGTGWPTSFDGATVTYVMTNLFKYGSLHTNSIVFQDYPDGTWFTNTWSWTATAFSPFATNGSLSVRGFDARLVQSLSSSSDPAVYTNYANINANAANGAWFTVLLDSLATAQTLLATPCQYVVNYAATNRVDFVNFDRNFETNNGIAATNFPGMCLPASASNPDCIDSFAVEVFAYLQLAAGTNRFMLYADDWARIYTGTNLTDNSTILATVDVTSQTFDWFVPQAGLYPIHIIYEEGMGGAYLCLYSVNLSSGALSLVNTNGGAVQAFYPLVVESSTSVAGPYTVDAAANAVNALQYQALTNCVACDAGTGTVTNSIPVIGGTLTLPASGPPKYYRLNGPRATKFTGGKKAGSNAVITYQAY